MKRTTLILASLLTFASASAFAEGGAERMNYYWANVLTHQQETPAKTEATVTLDQQQNTQAQVAPDDQTAQVTRPNA